MPLNNISLMSMVYLYLYTYGFKYIYTYGFICMCLVNLMNARALISIIILPMCSVHVRAYYANVCTVTRVTHTELKRR